MSLSDGMALEQECGWMYEDKKMYKVLCVVTEVKEVCLEADTLEEFELKLKELGYKIAPCSVPVQTSKSKETRVIY